MHEPDIALVFTADRWVVGLHRYLSDHGGARVRQLIVEPSVTMDDDYDVLVVDRCWPALTPQLVQAVHERRRSVFVVTRTSAPRALADVEALGADGSAEAACPPEEMVRLLQACRRRRPSGVVAVTRVSASPDPAARGRVVAVAGPGGAGATEVALALATNVAARHGLRAVLVDADLTSAAVAQRLGLPIEPNLRDAVEAIDHGRELLGAVQAVRGGALAVVAGFPSAFSAAHCHVGQVAAVVAALAAHFDCVIVDHSRNEPIGSADSLVAVGGGTPVGVTRLLGWLADARHRCDATHHLVVNPAPADRYRRSEIAAEVQRTVAARSITYLPYDRAIGRAAWDSRPLDRGPFVAGVAGLARELLAGPRREAHAAPADVEALGARRRSA